MQHAIDLPPTGSLLQVQFSMAIDIKWQEGLETHLYNVRKECVFNR